MKYKLVTFYVEFLDKMIRILMSMRDYARPPKKPIIEEGTFDSLFGNINKIADESEFNSKINQK